VGLRINTNITALNAHRTLNSNDAALGRSLARLSSGLRINAASDDAACLAIAEKFKAQVKGLSQASANAQDAINLLQTAEGALNETQSILQRMRELAVQSANDTLTDTDRESIQAEVDQLTLEIDGIAERTQYNEIDLLSGTATLTFQIGANNGQTLTVGVTAMDAAGLAVESSDLSVGTQVAAAAAITALDTALGDVSERRGELGGFINRLEHTIANLNVQRENMASSESRIRDLDMAAEVSNLSRAQILAQSSQAMLAQANAAPQGVLSLLR